MDVSAGSVVRLKNERCVGWNSMGDMDMYKGAIVVIYKRIGSNMYLKPHPEDDKPVGYWTFSLSDIEEVLENRVEPSQYLIYN